MMITALLIVIVVLLVGVLALLLTGWPGRERKEIEKTGQELRRELAQQRADSVQLLHAMRIELEESVRETLEQQFESFEMMQRRPSSRQKKSYSTQEGIASKLEAEGSQGGEKGYRLQLSDRDRQLPLFQEKKIEEETVYIESQFFSDDDLPDIEEELTDIDMEKEQKE